MRCKMANRVVKKNNTLKVKQTKKIASKKAPDRVTKPVKKKSTETQSKPKIAVKPKPEISKPSKSKLPTSSKSKLPTPQKTETVQTSLISDLRSTLQKDLLEEKANLESRIAAIEIIPSESTGDFGDISSALSDEGLRIIERDRLLGQLEKVKQVLNRLTTDKYFANCDDCGEEIEYKRLIFIPTARRCVHCQQNAERK